MEEEEPEPRFGGFYGEPVRALLINVPLVLRLISTKYTSWLYQERPRQPDPASGFTQAMDFRGHQVFAEPTEAWASQWLSNLAWIVLAACAALLWLRTHRRPGTPVFRMPEDGVYHPAEFIAIVIGLGFFAASIVLREF